MGTAQKENRRAITGGNESSRNKTRRANPTIELSAYIEKLDESVAMLITLGHLNCWNYGYSFFKISLKAVHSLQKQLVQSLALAIGLALAGKKEDWDKFLKE